MTVTLQSPLRLVPDTCEPWCTQHDGHTCRNTPDTVGSFTCHLERDPGSPPVLVTRTGDVVNRIPMAEPANFILCLWPSYDTLVAASPATEVA